MGRSDEVYDSGIEKTKQYGEGVGKSAKNTVDAGTRKVSQAVRRQIHNNIRKKAGSGSRNTLRGKRNNIVEKGGKAVRKTVRGVSNGVKGLNSSGSVGSAGRSMASNGAKVGAKVGAKATRAGAKAVANATKFIVKVAPKVAKAVFNVLKEAITAIVKFCVACPLVALVILVILLIVLLVVSVVKSTKDDNVLFNNFDNRVRNEVKYTTNEDGDKVAVVESYSSKNAAILAYYKTMSERSVWELKDDGTLVNLADEEASKDHLKREDLVEVNPILLYYLNDTFYGDTLVYPEQFVQPVAFDKDKMELKDIVNDKEKVTVESPVLSKKTGQPKGDKTSKSLSAYGLGSVVTFTDTVIYSSVEGNYVQKEVWDEEKSEVVVEEINEPFHFDKGSKSVRVMDEAITFAGKIKFGYSNTLKLTKAVTDGESTDEESNVKQIIYDTKKVEVYTAQKDGIVVTGKTKKWCEKNEYRIISEPIEKEIKLHKIRSSTSGLYSSALTPTVVEPEKGENNYLKDYLTRFESYVPTYKGRTYDRLSRITGVANINKDYSGKGSRSSSGGSGNASMTAYQQAYLDLMIPLALEMQKESGISAAVIVAQGALESGWGESVSGTYNYFGIKGKNGTKKLTEEVVNGNRITITDSFVNYDDPLDCVRDYCKKIWTTRNGDKYRYRDAVGKSYEEAITIIRDGGYCTEVREVYIGSVCSIVETYGLAELESDPAYQWDGTPPDYVDGDDDGSGGGSSGSDYSSYAAGLSDDDLEVFKDFVNTFGENSYKEKEKGTYNKVSESLSNKEMNQLIRKVQSGVSGVSMDSLEGVTIDNVKLWDTNFVGTGETNKDADITGGGASASYTGDEKFMWPVPICTVITSPFGPRNTGIAGASTFHKGIDIGCFTGSDVVATMDGTVIFAAYAGNAGNMVSILHDDGYLSRYLHNDVLKVKAGDKVKQGQVIALSGSTGIGSGPHLHFEIRTGASASNQGEAVNPLLYVNPAQEIKKNADGSYDGSSTVDKTSEVTSALADTTKERQDIVNFALSYVGKIPYIYGGADLNTGVDCSGFMMKIYENFGYSITRTAQSQHDATIRIERKELQPGDLIFYKKTGETSIGHVTMYIGGGKVVHASSSKTGLIVSDIKYREPYAYGRVKGCAVK